MDGLVWFAQLFCPFNVQGIDHAADFVFDQSLSRRLRQRQLQRNVAQGKQVQFVALKQTFSALTLIGLARGGNILVWPQFL